VRADANLPVVLRHPDADVEITAVDLSEGGMRCSTRAEAAVKAGDSVVAEFSPGRRLTVPASSSNSDGGELPETARMDG
jgi:hypothetical protein